LNITIVGIENPQQQQQQQQQPRAGGGEDGIIARAYVEQRKRDIA
jgi:hypothetical protein